MIQSQYKNTAVTFVFKYHTAAENGGTLVIQLNLVSKLMNASAMIACLSAVTAVSEYHTAEAK